MATKTTTPSGLPTGATTPGGFASRLKTTPGGSATALKPTTTGGVASALKPPTVTAAATAGVTAGFDPAQDVARSQAAFEAGEVGVPVQPALPSKPQLPETFEVPTTTEPIDIPPVSALDTTDSFMSGTEPAQAAIQTDVERLRAEADALTAPAEAEQEALTERLKEQLGELPKRGERLLEEEKRLGIETQQKQLQELNLQIAQQTAEFNNLIEGVPGKRVGVTKPFVEGEQAMLRRQKAVEVGGLSAIAQAVQGNVALAQQTAERTVNLEFEDAEQEIRNLQTLLEVNKDKLGRADKKRAEQLELNLNERERILAEEKENKLNIFSLAMQAVEGGADNATLQDILKSPSMETALTKASQFLTPQVSEFEQKEQELELENKRLDNQKLRQEMGLSPTGNAGQTANIDTFMSALMGQESGGDFNAENARTGAFGAFQIMPANWDSWASEAGLPPGTQQTPENQNAVTKFKIDQYFNKYGNWADVASVWYSGRPLSQVEAEGWADDRQGDGSEPSVREYVNSVLNRLPQSTVSLDQKDTLKFNKEIAQSDSYKAVINAQDSNRLLDNFEKIFQEVGNQRFGEEAQKLKSAYQQTLLNLKELFNLGVLNGPDLDLMQSLLPDPTAKIGLFLKGGEKGVQAGIDEVRNMILGHVSARSRDLETAYQDYSPDQLTNLQNVARIKQELNIQ